MALTVSGELAAEARHELLDKILPFWRRHGPDHHNGGFIAELSNELQPNLSAGKGLILNARILWTFSAVWQLTRSLEDRALAERACDYLSQRFLDREHGGYFWELDPGGCPVNQTKKIYGQAFAIYALTEYHRAFGDASALASAKEVFRLIEQFSRDTGNAGYLETLSQNWQPCEDMRLSEKDLNEKKSMNNHLHILEAYTQLFRAWPDPLLGTRLRELIEIFQRRILHASGAHFDHFFDEAWNPRSDTYTYGHDIEGSWLLCEAADALGDEILRNSIRTTAIRIASAVLKEGVDSDGGLFYEGRNGVVTRDVKEWWPQAEAVVGFLNAWELTEDPPFLEAAAKCWRFIQERIVDRSHGEWFWAVSRDGTPDLSLPKVSMWKCPYHNSRACLEIIRKYDYAQTL